MGKHTEYTLAVFLMYSTELYSTIFSACNICCVILFFFLLKINKREQNLSAGGHTLDQPPPHGSLPPFSYPRWIGILMGSVPPLWFPVARYVTSDITGGSHSGGPILPQSGCHLSLFRLVPNAAYSFPTLSFNVTSQQPLCFLRVAPPIQYPLLKSPLWICLYICTGLDQFVHETTVTVEKTNQRQIKNCRSFTALLTTSITGTFSYQWI